MNAQKNSPSLERQRWLELAVEVLRTKFADAGYTVPQKIRVSIGRPKLAASCPDRQSVRATGITLTTTSGNNRQDRKS